MIDPTRSLRPPSKPNVTHKAGLISVGGTILALIAIAILSGLLVRGLVQAFDLGWHVFGAA